MAAAAAEKVGAAGVDAIRRGFENADQVGAFGMVARTGTLGFHQFAGQHEGREDHFPIGPAKPFAAVNQFFNFQLCYPGVQLGRHYAECTRD